MCVSSQLLQDPTNSLINAHDDLVLSNEWMVWASRQSRSICATLKVFYVAMISNSIISIDKPWMKTRSNFSFVFLEPFHLQQQEAFKLATILHFFEYPFIKLCKQLSFKNDETDYGWNTEKMIETIRKIIATSNLSRAVLFRS